MANLARRENMFEDLFDFRRNFDDMFNRLLRGSRPGGHGERPRMEIVSIPPVEAWVDSNDKQYHVRIALPGVDPNDVQLNLEGDTLTVSGEHKTDHEKKGVDYLQKEFSYESFQRSILLPEGIDREKINAEYNNGILEITAPLSASALPKQIPIKSSPKAKATSA
jgi:HSP20 family protein